MFRMSIVKYPDICLTTEEKAIQLYKYYCNIEYYWFVTKQDWVTNTSGHRVRTKLKRAYSSGCQLADRLHLRTGTRVNQTTSGTRTGKKSTVWNCGIAMGKDSSGTTRPVRLRHSSCAKCRDFCGKI